MKSKQLVIINSGSSSIKFAVYQFDSSLKKSLYGQVENIKSDPILKTYDAKDVLLNQQNFFKNLDYDDYFKLLISAFESNKFNFEVVAVGHRVVHGGNQYQQPVLMTQEILQNLKKLIPFAPLHQPFNLNAIESIFNIYPKLPQVACFDTAFHRTHPAVADRFGIPRNLSAAGVRRYGFHGLSYEYIMHKINEIYPEQAKNRIIVAHLGNGASMCAIKDGKSIESTMGFTALDGLVMGTRCGTLDPGIILYLLQSKNMRAEEIETMLYKKSGLLGVSGISHDMKKLLDDTSTAAKEAVELFVYRIRRELGALTAALGGLDMLIFTGGIGEHSSQIRERVCENNEWLGIQINPELNEQNNSMLSDAKSKVKVLVLPTNEEWIIAKHSYQLLSRNL